MAARQGTAVGFCLAAMLAAAPAQATRPLPAAGAYDLGFSPGHSALRVVLLGIRNAQTSILVAAYEFTSRPIASALVSAAHRGVKVYIVADREESTKPYSLVRSLARQGVQVRLNGNYRDLHDKFMVIDGLHVETGSFNFTAGADRSNAENALLLWNVKPMADAYAVQWRRLWNEGQDVPPGA
ncbi:MAG: phospholipase D family protein [Burkholderiaceae bacterium]|nr:MAG: phospholipase D family protein [Burkholderiaceae bacterium]